MFSSIPFQGHNIFWAHLNQTLMCCAVQRIAGQIQIPIGIRNFRRQGEEEVTTELKLHGVTSAPRYQTWPGLLVQLWGLRRTQGHGEACRKVRVTGMVTCTWFPLTCMHRAAQDAALGSPAFSVSPGTHWMRFDASVSWSSWNLARAAMHFHGLSTQTFPCFSLSLLPPTPTPSLSFQFAFGFFFHIVNWAVFCTGIVQVNASKML